MPVLAAIVLQPPTNLISSSSSLMKMIRLHRLPWARARAPRGRAREMSSTAAAGVAGIAGPPALRFFQINAFADRPFSGNPAAVFLIPRRGPGPWGINDDMMKRIAKEMLLSETAFVTPQGEGTFESSTRFLLRWFTPTREVDLCGHGTLATAAALALECNNSAARLDFDTRSGTLTATRHGRGSEFELDFPSNPPHALEAASAEAGVHREIARLAVGEQHTASVAQLAYSPTTKKLVVQMDPTSFTRGALEALDVPSPESLLAVKQLGTSQVTGVMVTVASEQGDFDFLSRYFAPWNGIKEDPVTGSAHTVLAPFWARELKKSPLPTGESGEGSIQLRARQCSPRGPLSFPLALIPLPPRHPALETRTGCAGFPIGDVAWICRWLLQEAIWC